MNFDGIFRKIKTDIERDGWSTIGVFPHDGDGQTFSYSVGFREHGQPEVIVVGLPPDFGHAMIASIYHRHIKEGKSISNGQRLDDVIEDYEVELRDLPLDGSPLNVAKRYYETDELQALQIVWPDEQGVYPGDEACDEAVVQAQDVERIRSEDVEGALARSHLRGDMKQPAEAAKALATSFDLPHVEGVLDAGDQLFELFRSWSNADRLDLERFWSDFDITSEAVQEFSLSCGMSMNVPPAAIGLMITFGAALAKARYRPKGQPEITI